MRLGNNNNTNRGDGLVIKGEKAGVVSVNRTTSTASVARMLEGIDFPAHKNDLVDHATQNKDRTEDSQSVIEVINRLPEKEFNNMADVEHEIGKVE